jgi:2-oxo-hept-3-ene-1,7-dioate hydratase
MISLNDRQRAADALFQAGNAVKLIPQVSKTWPDMEIDDAYAVQQLWAERRVQAGARVIGHKIGLTSRAMQMASKMTEPDCGVLLDDMAYADGARIPASKFTAPRIEVELAFVLGKRVGGRNVTMYDVLDGQPARAPRHHAGAGHILLAGSFTRPVNVAAGDVIHADFGPLGAIGVSFS